MITLNSKTRSELWISLVLVIGASRLAVYMTQETTTIRVSVGTRDKLRDLSARRGEPAGEIVRRLVDVADEEALLAASALGFERIATDPQLAAAYGRETAEIEDAFGARLPEW